MSRSWTPRELYYVDKIITLINNRTYEEGGDKLIMARQCIKYKLAGRYMNKSDTVAYGVLSEGGQERRLTEEQLAFLVGREQIINVTAQLYKDRVIFRGKDCSISEMPVIQVNKQYNELLKNKQNNINTSSKNTSSIIQVIIY